MSSLDSGGEVSFSSPGLAVKSPGETPCSGSGCKMSFYIPVIDNKSFFDFAENVPFFVTEFESKSYSEAKFFPASDSGDSMSWPL